MKVVLLLLTCLASCSPSRTAGKDAPTGVHAEARPAPRTSTTDASPSGTSPGTAATPPRSGLERYAQESRDETFAIPREELYASVFPILRRKLPGLELHASCKQTSCKIVARMPVDLAPDPDLPELQRIPWGDPVSVTFDRSDPSQVVVLFYPVLDGPMADLDHHRALMDRAVSRP